MTSSLALAVVPISSRWTMEAVITWPVPSVAVNSAGSAWRRYPTCTTSGTRVIPLFQEDVFRFSCKCSHKSTLFLPCSPSGCTFWGKKPWSRKKKILWQLGTLIGAPVGITLIAGIAVPAMVIGIPVYIGRKVRKNIEEEETTFCLWFIGKNIKLRIFKCADLNLLQENLFFLSLMSNLLPNKSERIWKENWDALYICTQINTF